MSDGVWQALVADVDGGWSQHFDFLRFDPQGKLYLQQVMQDGLSDRVTPGTTMEQALAVAQPKSCNIREALVGPQYTLLIE